MKTEKELGVVLRRNITLLRQGNHSWGEKKKKRNKALYTRKEKRFA